jgi:hypothetical protein
MSADQGQHPDAVGEPECERLGERSLELAIAKLAGQVEERPSGGGNRDPVPDGELAVAQRGRPVNPDPRVSAGVATGDADVDEPWVDSVRDETPEASGRAVAEAARGEQARTAAIA